MTNIRIIVDQEITKKSVICQIDNRTLDVVCNKNCIDIIHDTYPGVHKLTVKLVDNIQLKIQDVLVEGHSIGMMLYMSWIEDSQEQKHQPATILWEPGLTWTLPFGVPLSFWTTLFYGKLPDRMLGTNMFSKYHMYFPETMTLPDKYPPLVKDFFCKDFDFIVLPKDCDPLRLPYSKVNIDALDADLTHSANQEVLQNFDWISNQAINLDSPWKKLWLKQHNKFLVDHDILPAVWQFVEHLKLNDIRGIFIGILPPGGFILPHLDDYPDNDVYYDNSYYLYLPLSWHAGNYFKFSGAGILKDVKILNVSNRSYVHSLVNDSNEPRVILSMYVGRASNPNIELSYV